MSAHSDAMLKAIAKVQHPSLSYHPYKQRAVIVALIHSFYGVALVDSDARAFSFLRRSLIGTSPVRHDQVALARTTIQEHVK